MNIDWSKAPEGATHALTTGKSWSGGRTLIGEIHFVKKVDGEYLDSHECRYKIGEDAWVELEERPKAEWNGEGLPPVGAVCEWRDARDEYSIDWQRVEVLYMSSHTALLKLEVEDGEDCEGAYYPANCLFRSLRAPEQIAAEERNEAYKGMIDDLAAVIGISNIDARECDALHALAAAGYRKTKGGAQ